MKLPQHSDEPLTFSTLPWIPGELCSSLSRVTSFLQDAFGRQVTRIGLYGSWQRGDAKTESDVDLVIFLNHEVSWFDAKRGVINRLSAFKDQFRWFVLEQKANKVTVDSKVFSIAVVTPAMLEYYASQGPIHLRNWVHALMNCYTLWDNRV